MNVGDGFIHEASWINDGPVPVNFGPTSDDEMMVLVLMYTEDEIDVGTAANGLDVFEGLKVSPNPMTEGAVVELPTDIGELTFRMYDMLGQEVRNETGIRTRQFEIRKGSLKSGMYVFTVEAASGQQKTGELIIE